MDKNYERYKWLEAEEMRPEVPNSRNLNMGKSIDSATRQMLNRQMELLGFNDEDDAI
jgi:hypothetical protein